MIKETMDKWKSTIRKRRFLELHNFKIYAEKARQLETQFPLRRKVKEKTNRD